MKRWQGWLVVAFLVFAIYSTPGAMGAVGNQFGGFVERGLGAAGEFVATALNGEPAGSVVDG